MELDRIVPNSIMSGGPEDLNLIELLWKQDVDLGVGKEVYDHSLREELERQRERECFKQQEKLKAQLAAREKEERSKQEEASRWLNQNYSRDGETGEWVRRQSKTNNAAKESGSSLSAATSTNTAATTDTGVDENDDLLTLEAALDYICTRVDTDDFQAETDSVVPMAGDTAVTTQPMLPAQHEIQQLSMAANLFQPQAQIMENEWTQVEEYLNISLAGVQASTEGPEMEAVTSASGLMMESGSVGTSQEQEFDVGVVVAGMDIKQELPLVSMVAMDDNLFTSSDLPLLQDASLPMSDLDPVNDLSEVRLTNASVPPQPMVMNSSLDWDVGNLTFFDNLTALNQNAADDIDLENMEDLFNTMTEASELLHGSVADINSSMALSSSDHQEASLPTTSFTEDLNDAFDGLEGATGGSDYDQHNNGFNRGPYKKISRLSESSSSSDSGFGGKGGFSSGSSPSSSSSSYAGSPSALGNQTTNSNDTDPHPHGGSKALAHQVAHNHTYNTLPGHTPREVKKYAPKPTSKKGPQCRDAKKAQDMKVPFSIEDIIESPVETFNDLLTKHTLSEEQLTLVRDIRRRGKNKLAAQNCRKRKVGAIVTLSDDTSELQKLRDRLLEERAAMERESRRMKDKFGQLYSHIFQSLRDEHGQPYDPSLYSLQQSSDGNVFLVPRNVSTTNGHHDSNDAATTTITPVDLALAINGTSNNAVGGATNGEEKHTDRMDRQMKKRRSDN